MPILSGAVRHLHQCTPPGPAAPYQDQPRVPAGTAGLGRRQYAPATGAETPMRYVVTHTTRTPAPATAHVRSRIHIHAYTQIHCSNHIRQVLARAHGRAATLLAPAPALVVPASTRARPIGRTGMLGSSHTGQTNRPHGHAGQLPHHARTQDTNLPAHVLPAIGNGRVLALHASNDVDALRRGVHDGMTLWLVDLHDVGPCLPAQPQHKVISLTADDV